MAKMCQQQINLIAAQNVVEDGNFGPQSVAALKNVQTVLGVPADGICGAKTWQALENAIKTQAGSGDWD
jgi:peptidoglycan hydrolase-like protein with peptidoglycan-binding domain